MTTVEIMASLAKLRTQVDVILTSLDKGSVDGAVNWANLSCVRAAYCLGDDGDWFYLVDIAEAAADASELQCAVLNALHRNGWKARVEVRTEW